MSAEIQKPKIMVLETCEFPIVELATENNYKLLELPQSLRDIFDEGFDTIRINSKELAASIPDFGGKTEANYSLLPHQDHLPSDRRRFLMLSQTRDTERGASTLALYPTLVEKIFPRVLNYFLTHREELQKTSTWESTFEITQEQFNRCMKSGDVETVLVEALGETTDPAALLFGRTGILGYLIQGDASNTLAQSIFDEHGENILVEEWKQPGVFIIDNSKVFHSRLGGNTNILKRNWLV